MTHDDVVSTIDAPPPADGAAVSVAPDGAADRPPVGGADRAPVGAADRPPDGAADRPLVGGADRAPTARPPHATAGTAIRAARIAAGISLRELARRTGMAPSTLHSLEEGTDARLSTLAACARVLPGLTPAALFGKEGSAVPDGTAGWQRLARIHGTWGHRLRRVLVLRRHARELLTSWRGIETSDGRLDDPDTLRRVLSGALLATPASRGERWTEDLLTNGHLVRERDGILHEARLVRRAGRLQLDVACREPWPAGQPVRLFGTAAAVPGVHSGDGCAACAMLPVELLSIGVVAHGVALPSEPHVGAWPCGLAGTRREHDLVGRAVVLPRVRRGRHSIVASFENPMPWITVGLTWDAEPPRPASTSVAVSSPAAPPGVNPFRRARRLAGVTLRELARRLHASPHVVHGAERGRDVRWSTMQRYLEALPALRPEHFFPPDEAPSDDAMSDDASGHDAMLDKAPSDDAMPDEASSDDAMLDELWRRGVDTWGTLGEEIAATLDLTDLTGREQWVSRATLVGDRTLPGREREILSVTPSMRYDAEVSPPTWGAVTTEGAGEAYRRRAIADGGWIRGVVERVAAGDAARPRTVSFEATGPLPLPRWPAGLYSESVDAPVERVRIVVHFPRGEMPESVRPFAEPSWEPASVSDRNVLDRAAPAPRHRVLLDRDAERAELIVHRPLMGLRYGLAWG